MKNRIKKITNGNHRKIELTPSLAQKDMCAVSTFPRNTGVNASTKIVDTKRV